ncbi:ribonuclease domain-containing protein [Pseudorhodoferax sp.]|uniref:ribonuclease domain-containing protein n=1 Tax=Pseudorhodoferax sp. TaxID=1993553 RepID=UPI002DD62241|nr:ribonuclease domain-containing protein [Pseudorhodoferax sp.]
MLSTICHTFSRSLWGGLLVVALAAGTVSVHARTTDASGVIALGTLPAEGRSTYERILQGGPFPYEKDGTVFFNRERLLPQHKRGYYREYTVARPGARSRGARRIVCGGLQPTTPDGCYYTSDHYASFRKIVP